MKVAIIGGGAAGFFTAISAKHHHPDARIVIFEKANKVLAKVKISGGGRCNLTHEFFDIKSFLKNYPRGQKFLRSALYQWSPINTIQWFESRGVSIKTEADGRVFPKSDRSQSVVDALVNEANQKGIIIKMHTPVKCLHLEDEFWWIETESEKEMFDAVVVCSGGSPKKEGLQWLLNLGQPIVEPVPSLFTFNIPHAPLTQLQGVSVKQAKVWIEGLGYENQGPLLITHWGLSGPGVLKLSAAAARDLARLDYSAKVHVNWIAELNEHTLAEIVDGQTHSKKKVLNDPIASIPSRLWAYLVDRAGLRPDVTWSELGRKQRNRLFEVITNDIYFMHGKTTFKEEFVTAGGVDISKVNPKTMGSKILPNLYFAGEVLDVDGYTGGFNFQAAWATGWLAGQLL